MVTNYEADMVHGMPHVMGTKSRAYPNQTSCRKSVLCILQSSISRRTALKIRQTMDPCLQPPGHKPHKREKSLIPRLIVESGIPWYTLYVSTRYTRVSYRIPVGLSVDAVPVSAKAITDNTRVSDKDN